MDAARLSVRVFLVLNEPNWPNLLNPFYVALGPPFILSRGYPQVAT